MGRRPQTVHLDQTRRTDPRVNRSTSYTDLRCRTLGEFGGTLAEFGGLPFLVLVGGCVMVEVSDESSAVMALRKCPVGVSGLDEVRGDRSGTGGEHQVARLGSAWSGRAWAACDRPHSG